MDDREFWIAAYLVALHGYSSRPSFESQSIDGIGGGPFYSKQNNPKNNAAEAKATADEALGHYQKEFGENAG